MRYRKLIVYFFTALLLMVAMMFGVMETRWDEGLTLSVTIPSGGQEEEIFCWKRGGTKYYLFLPGYADLSEMTLHTNVSNTVYLNGQILTDGSTCENISLDTRYEVVYENGNESDPFTLVFVQGSDVAAMYVDTASGSMDHIHEDIEHEEAGTVRLYTAQGTLDYSGNMESLKGRGSSTWKLEKKPYNMTLYTEGDLLGMGSAARWVLLANGYDPTSLRNKMVYDFARDLGMAYSPDCQWVDLYLNGEYAGLYLLSERNEVHSQRVDLNGQGSFLVSKDWQWRMAEKGQSYFMTESGAALRILSSDIGTEELIQVWQTAENAILAEGGIDPVTGKHWTELIDLDSWARKYLVEEIFANVDAATLSQFFYRDRTGKICAGPVWDYDLTLRSGYAPNMFYAGRDYLHGSKWYKALYDKIEFRERVAQLYESDCRPLLQTLLDSRIETYTAATALSSQMNSIRWWTDGIDEAVSQLRSSLSDRVAFLDSLWIDQETYLTIHVLGYDGAVYCYGIRPGETLPSLERYENIENVTIYGWYDFLTGEAYDPAEPLWEDKVIYLKYDMGE